MKEVIFLAFPANNHSFSNPGKGAPSKYFLKKHMVTVHRYKRFDTTYNKPMQPLSDIKTFDCGICDHSFTDKTNYDKHMKTHTGKYRFKCYICGKGFTQQNFLLRHYQFEKYSSL